MVSMQVAIVRAQGCHQPLGTLYPRLQRQASHFTESISRENCLLLVSVEQGYGVYLNVCICPKKTRLCKEYLLSPDPSPTRFFFYKFSAVSIPFVDEKTRSLKYFENLPEASEQRHCNANLDSFNILSSRSTNLLPPLPDKQSLHFFFMSIKCA